MGNISKRMQKLNEKSTGEENLAVADAIASVKKNATAKFDETVEVAVRLGIDARKSDQMVRGVVAMPAGTGETVRVAVACQEDKVKEAVDAGADIVGLDECIAMISKEKFDFDVLIAEPAIMAQLGKHGKVLGPKGLMPNPKSGTVTNDIAAAVKQAKHGQVTYRTEKAGIIHAAIGRASFSESDLESNFMALIGSLKQAKPASAKGQFLVNARMSSTMGPAVRIDVSPLR